MPRLNIAKGGSSVLLSSRRIVNKIVHDIIRNKSIVLQLKPQDAISFGGTKKETFFAIHVYIYISLQKRFESRSFSLRVSLSLEKFIWMRVCVCISWCNRLKENKMNVLFASR